MLRKALLIAFTTGAAARLFHAYRQRQAEVAAARPL